MRLALGSVCYVYPKLNFARQCARPYELLLLTNTFCSPGQEHVFADILYFQANDKATPALHTSQDPLTGSNVGFGNFSRLSRIL